MVRSRTACRRATRADLRVGEGAQGCRGRSPGLVWGEGRGYGGHWGPELGGPPPLAATPPQLDDFVSSRVRRWLPWGCRGTGAWDGAPTPRRIHSPLMWFGRVGGPFGGRRGGGPQGAAHPPPLPQGWSLSGGLGGGGPLWLAVTMLVLDVHFAWPGCQGLSAACAGVLAGGGSSYEVALCMVVGWLAPSFPAGREDSKGQGGRRSGEEEKGGHDGRAR